MKEIFWPLDFLGKIVKEVSCSGDHTLLLTDDGIVFTWGNNGEGQLGMVDPEKANLGGNFGKNRKVVVGKPVMLTALLSYNIVKINAGDGCSSVLGHKSSFFNKIEFLVWGNTTYLGMKDNRVIKTPMVHPFFEGKNVQNAALGARHSFVCANNQIYGFGSNAYGQLGCKGNLHNIYTEGEYKIRQLSTEDWVIKSVKSVAEIGEIWDVQIDENCSYFLTTLNLIFACGINTNNRLGLKTKDLVVH